MRRVPRWVDFESVVPDGGRKMTDLVCATDPGVDAQRGVPVDERDDDKRQLDADAAVPELRAAAGDPVRHGAGDLSRRRACDQGGQRGVGLVFRRQEAL